MAGSPLVSWALVLVSAVAAATCLLRARQPVALAAEERRISRVEGGKGLAMALMAVPAPAAWQRPWSGPLFVALAAALVVWSVLRTVRDRRPAHHAHLVIGSGAMLYMAWAMAAAPPGAMAGMTENTAGGMTGGGMAAMSGAASAPLGIPLVTGLLLCYFAGYTLWSGLRVVLPAGAALPAPAAAAPGTGTAGAGTGGTGGAGTGVGALLATPEVASACRVSLSVAMFAMLLFL